MSKRPFLFLPLILSILFLQGIFAASESEAKILVLYKERDPDHAGIISILTPLLKQAGYDFDTRDVEELLVKKPDMESYTGIMTCYQTSQMVGGDIYPQWLVEQMEAGRRILIIGSYGAYQGVIPKPDGTFVERSETTRTINTFFHPFGLEFHFAFTSDNNKLRLVTADKEYSQFQAPITQKDLRYYQLYTSVNPENKIFFELERTDMTASRSALNVITPFGGMVLEGYSYFWDPEKNKTVFRVNFPEFIKEAFSARSHVPSDEESEKEKSKELIGREIVKKQKVLQKADVKEEVMEMDLVKSMDAGKKEEVRYDKKGEEEKKVISDGSHVSSDEEIEKEKSKELTGREIMEKQKVLQKADDEIEIMQMKLIKGKDVRKREVVRYNKKGEEENDKIMIMFLEPRDVEGTGVLTWEHKDRSDDQWLYLPARRRETRISGSSKKNLFMGTDFSFGDLRSEKLSLYDYERLSDKKRGGRDCFVVKAVPNTEKEEKDSGYGARILWIRKGTFFTEKIRYYDTTYDPKKKKNKVLKFCVYSNVVNPEGHFWRATKTRMKNLKRKHETILLVKDRKLNSGISGDKLTLRQLKKGPD